MNSYVVDVAALKARLAKAAAGRRGTPTLADCEAWQRWDGAEAPKPGRKRRERKPSVATLIKRAEKAGKTVTSVTVDGVTLMFDQPSPAKRSSWDDLETGTRQ